MVAATPIFCAAALEDGSINVYSLTGRRCASPGPRGEQYTYGYSLQVDPDDALR